MVKKLIAIETTTGVLPADVETRILAIAQSKPTAWVALDLTGAGGSPTARSGHFAPGSRLVGDRVELRGGLTFGGSYTAGQTIGTLPVSHRPTSTVTLGGRSSTASALFTINTDGTITKTGNQSAADHVMLDGLFFTRA